VLRPRFEPHTSQKHVRNLNVINLLFTYTHCIAEIIKIWYVTMGWAFNTDEETKNQPVLKLVVRPPEIWQYKEDKKAKVTKLRIRTRLKQLGDEISQSV